MRIHYATLALIALLLPGLATPEPRTVTLGDCTFTADPDQFQARESRFRRDLSLATQRVTAAIPRAANQKTAAPNDIPRRNFIDDAIFGALSQRGIPSANLTTDEEFFRRINFDILGRIPLPDEIREFVNGANPNKRSAVIDQLLNSPFFVDRWSMWLGDLLQNTATSSNVNRQNTGRDAFYEWIRASVRADKPLNTMAYEVVTGVGNTYDPYRGNTNYAYGMTTPMGPIQDMYDTYLSRTAQTFLGLGYYDCLLCHNGRGHLNSVSLWGQQVTRAETWQLSAFFSRTRMARNPQPQGQPLYNSADISDLTSGTYDLNTSYGNRPNRTPIGSVRSMTPVYRDGRAPDNRSTWRASFAQFMITDPMFARNLANRLWKQFFNLGLIEPVDSLDPARVDPNNPPPAPWSLQASNPQLLEDLAKALVERNFNLRESIRLLVESSAYQLSSRYEGNDWSIEYIPYYARHYPRRLQGEEIADAIVKATGVSGGYTVTGWGNFEVSWAMQLPDTVSGGGAAAFMNAFLRGNRDTVQRSQAGSIQQQLTLMNDAFVTNKLKVNASPRLRVISQMTDSNALVEELFLNFLIRYPTSSEREVALDALKTATTATQKNNTVEDLAWVLVNKLEFLFSY
jgi:hypothetical protein